MRRKVLFVINSLAGGGAEHVMATLLGGSGAQARDADIVVVLLDRDEEAYALPGFVRVIRLDCGHSLVRSLRALVRVVRAERPDVALSFLTRANVCTAAAMTLIGRPFVLSERVNTTAHLGQGRAAALSKALVRLSYPRARRIVAVSGGVGDTLVADFGVRRERIVVAANPIDTDAIEARAAEPPAVPIDGPYAVAMGRLVPNKNFALAIEAFARSGVDGKLVILGQGPERAALAALGDRLGLGERLVMPGFAANPYAVIARAWVMLLSSNAEGFPNALVEALATGVPVIATDCQSGPAEVLDVAIPADGDHAEGRGGVLVPVNDVAAMAGAIARMDAGAQARLSAAGRVRVRDFSVARAVETYWRVIDEAAAAR